MGITLVFASWHKRRRGLRQLVGAPCAALHWVPVDRLKHHLVLGAERSDVPREGAPDPAFGLSFPRKWARDSVLVDVLSVAELHKRPEVPPLLPNEEGVNASFAGRVPRGEERLVPGLLCQLGTLEKAAKGAVTLRALEVGAAVLLGGVQADRVEDRMHSI